MNADVTCNGRHKILKEGRRIILRIRFVHGNDVFDAIFIDVAHNETIAAAEIDARGHRVVDEMFPPADVLADCRLRLGHGVADRRLGMGCPETNADQTQSAQ